MTEPTASARKRGAQLARRLLASLPETQQIQIRRLLNKTRSLPDMSIGILAGPTPWALEEAHGQAAPIITAQDVTDAKAAFVADPFAIERDGTWHLFFELMNRRTGKGQIGCAISVDLKKWIYRGSVLAEPFHLSYPAVYEVDGVTWMIPESWEAKQVRLYRANAFPEGWVFDRVLIDDIAATDPTLYRQSDGSWSMLLCDAGRVPNSTLRRYDAPDLTGPWVEGAKSPLIVDRPDQARPGGHVFEVGGTAFRMGQDCSQRYGESLRSFPLREPWSTGGQSVLIPTGAGWRGRGGHHADLHLLPDGSFIAFVDGES